MKQKYLNYLEFSTAIIGWFIPVIIMYIHSKTFFDSTYFQSRFFWGISYSSFILSVYGLKLLWIKNKNFLIFSLFSIITNLAFYWAFIFISLILFYLFPNSGIPLFANYYILAMIFYSICISVFTRNNINLKT
jgi:hypothetical protein